MRRERIRRSTGLLTFAPLLLVFLFLPLLAGCAAPGTTTTVTTTTVECIVPEEGFEEGAPVDTQECTTVTEETSTSKRPRQCHGVVSCSFYVVGEAISLPFRALGAVLGILF